MCSMDGSHWIVSGVLLSNTEASPSRNKLIRGSGVLDLVIWSLRVDIQVVLQFLRVAA